MPRTRSGPASRARRKKVMKAVKGYVGGRSRTYRQAKDTVERAMCYAYRDRKARKRDFRRLWITRISAAARNNGISYSRFIQGLKKSSIGLDRKILADLAVSDPSGFTAIAEKAKAAL